MCFTATCRVLDPADDSNNSCRTRQSSYGRLLPQHTASRSRLLGGRGSSVESTAVGPTCAVSWLIIPATCSTSSSRSSLSSLRCTRAHSFMDTGPVSRAVLSVPLLLMISVFQWRLCLSGALRGSEFELWRRPRRRCPRRHSRLLCGDTPRELWKPIFPARNSL